MIARPYQVTAIAKVKDEWETVDRTLLVLPTGTGKTLIFSWLASDIVSQGGRVLILAHRDELIRQAADKLQRSTGLSCAVEKADEMALGSFYRVTVGSVQTMMSINRLDRFGPSYYTHIIVDEAHHCLSDSYQRVLAYYAGAKVLGVTATPDRGDRRNLGQYFQSLAFEYTLPQAIREGFLCPIKAQTIPLNINLAGVKMQAGDFSAADVGSALDPYLPQIAGAIAQHCRERKTLIFAPLCDTARRIRDAIEAAGLRCYYSDGTYRDEIKPFEQYGRGCCMVNAMLLTEGYDHPPIDAVCVLRATKVRALYAQMIGRGTRPLPGKDHLLLIDFLWHSERHQLCRPAHLIAESEDVAARMVAKAEEAAASGETVDIDDEAVAAAKAEVVKEREEKLAEQLKQMRAKKAKLVDPLQYAMSIGSEDLVDYEPQFPHEQAPASPKQLELLEQAGILPDGVKNAGMASMILDRIKLRKLSGFATPKQIRCLERFGFEHAGNMLFEEANRTITRISANGWRVPDDINPRLKQPEAAKRLFVFA